MNELIFLFHTTLIMLCVLGALKLGKEALIALICLFCVLCNLFVVKQTEFFGINATCADAFSIGAVLGLNLLQEYFGRAITQKAIVISFLGSLVYAVLSQIHLMYIPSACDTMHCHFSPLLEAMPRIIIASLVVYLVVQQLDCLLYEWLKKRFKGNFLASRVFSSAIVCQLLDTILFSFLGLYGIINNIGHLIMVSYLIKLVTLVCATPFVALSKWLITSDSYQKQD